MNKAAPKKNIRIGRPPIYGFDTIREGGRKFIATSRIEACRRAAAKYAERKGIRLKTEPSEDGRGVDVRRVRPRKEK